MTAYWFIPGALALTVIVYFLLRHHANQQNEAGITTSTSARLIKLGGLTGRSLWRKIRFGIRRLLANREQRQKLQDEYHLQTAEEAAKVLGNMKGVFMKIGQIVSFANESMPEHARQALQKLQQDAPPMAFDLVRSVVEAELNKDMGSVFKDFAEEPLAAASIGQVHRAKLKDGTDVAVKVQYPGIADAIRADLNATGMLAAMINSVNKNIDAKAVVAELRERLNDELDYRREAQNQQLFCDLWAGHPYIRIPKVYHEHTRSRLLVQEFKKGLKFYDFLEAANRKEKNVAVHVLMDFVYESMFRFHVFNGDPHPGNYIFHEDGGITFLDFGCIKYFNAQLIDDLTALSRALVNGNRSSFNALCRRIQIVLPDRPMDADFLWDFFSYHIGPYVRDEVFTFDKAWLEKAGQVMDIQKLQGINLPPDLLFFNRITFGLNAIFQQLGASANFYRMNLRYLYPEQNLPPATSYLGIQLEPRFLDARKAAVTRPKD